MPCAKGRGRRNASVFPGCFGFTGDVCLLLFACLLLHTGFPIPQEFHRGIQKKRRCHTKRSLFLRVREANDGGGGTECWSSSSLADQGSWFNITVKACQGASFTWHELTWPGFGGWIERPVEPPEPLFISFISWSLIYKILPDFKTFIHGGKYCTTTCCFHLWLCSVWGLLKIKVIMWLVQPFSHAEVHGAMWPDPTDQHLSSQHSQV